MKTPKVSCVTVTTGRVDLLKKAIHCYVYQTYKNRELVILAQGNFDRIKLYVDSLDL